MSFCDKCGQEVGNLYCGKCREEIRQKERPAVPSEELVILMAYDPTNDTYRFGCSVVGCPCNLQNGWCSKAVIGHIGDKDNFEQVRRMLHAYDGDNGVKQFCG